MQDSKRSELMEAIRRAVTLFREAGRRFLNKDIVDAVIETNGSLSTNWAASWRGRSCLI